MSLDDKTEEAAIQAVVNIGGIIRKTERQRICMEIVRLAVKIGGFKIEELPR